MVSEIIKAAVSVLEFVSQYVDLKLAPSGALGLCPFHDDHHFTTAMRELVEMLL
jgi:DNA primase